MEKILSGKPVTNSILEAIREDLQDLSLTPSLALIMVGKDPASEYYVKNIIRHGSKLGMEINLIELPKTIETDELICQIRDFNSNNLVHGIMIQKPLPKHVREEEINDAISPEKDIDGIHPFNLGKLFMAQDCFIPCTAAAALELIKYYQIETTGKHIVILGRSTVVAKPLAGLLLQKTKYGNATVSICHSYTQNLAEITQTADILIAAIGKPHFVTANMIKEHAICIDVGINLIHDDEKGDVYVGDFDYEDCFNKSSAITPVPGGIGSITTSLLLQNLVKAVRVSKNKEKKLT